MKEDEIPTRLEDIDDDAREILEDLAEELEIDLESVVFPYHKLDILWHDLSEEEYREHMRKTLNMLTED